MGFVVRAGLTEVHRQPGRGPNGPLVLVLGPRTGDGDRVDLWACAIRAIVSILLAQTAGCPWLFSERPFRWGWYPTPSIGLGFSLLLLWGLVADMTPRLGVCPSLSPQSRHCVGWASRLDSCVYACVLTDNLKQMNDVVPPSPGEHSPTTLHLQFYHLFKHSFIFLLSTNMF